MACDKSVVHFGFHFDENLWGGEKKKKKGITTKILAERLCGGIMH